MASIFNSLPLAQTVVGTLTEQRNIVLYKQEDNFGNTVLDVLTKGGDIEEVVKANVSELVGYLVQKNELEELFTGIDVPYLSRLNGYNAFGVSYVDGKVSIASDIAEHPIEDGTMITDAAILKPVTAEIRVAMPTALYTRIYQQISDYYTKKKKIMIKCKFGMIRDMVIAEMPFELKPDEVDRPIITLKLRQIIEVAPENILMEFAKNMVANASDSDTQDNGLTVADAVLNSLRERK